MLGHSHALSGLAAGAATLPWAPVYFTDRGLEELADRRGEEQVTLAWLADQMQVFVDLNPDFEVPVERLATWLARGGADPDADE